MSSVCHVLVSSNSLRANRSSHGECRCEPRTCPQWPRESCGHQPAPLSAPQWCRSCQRSLSPPGVVSCKLGQQDCTVLHRGRRWLHTTPARSCHCLFHREFEGLQRDAVDQVLQAVKFTDKNAPGLSLALDEEFQAANCFTEFIRGYTMGAVEPYTMMGLQPTGPTRVNLEVIVPSPTGLTPAKWKQTATLCPLDWPSNYSLLRLWHTTKSFHQYAAQLKQQMQHRHMFTHWEVNRTKLASRVLFQRPAHYVPEAMLRQHVQERVFPDRRLRRKTQETDRVAFQAKCNELRLLAAGEERTNPVSFAIGNSWNDTLRADKQHYLEYTTRSLT